MAGVHGRRGDLVARPLRSRSRSASDDDRVRVVGVVDDRVRSGLRSTSVTYRCDVVAISMETFDLVVALRIRVAPAAESPCELRGHIRCCSGQTPRTPGRRSGRDVHVPAVLQGEEHPGHIAPALAPADVRAAAPRSRRSAPGSPGCPTSARSRIPGRRVRSHHRAPLPNQTPQVRPLRPNRRSVLWKRPSGAPRLFSKAFLSPGVRPAQLRVETDRPTSPSPANGLLESVGGVLYHASKRLVEVLLFVSAEHAIARLRQAPDRENVELWHRPRREARRQIGACQRATIGSMSTGHPALLLACRRAGGCDGNASPPERTSRWRRARRASRVDAARCRCRWAQCGG